MKNWLGLCFLLLISLKVSAQNSAMRLPVPTQKSIKSFELKVGVYESSLKMTDLSKWKMMFSIPELKPNEEVNVVLALHWGVNAAGYREFMECLILPSFDKNKYIIVAPDAERTPWWISPKKDQLVSLVKTVRKHWPVNKVIVIGYSDGATGSVHLAQHASAHFDGAIGIAGSYSYIQEFTIPTYLVHGRGDQLFDYEQTKRAISESVGEDVVFVTSEELTHFEACRYVPYLKDAVAWMEKKLNPP